MNEPDEMIAEEKNILLSIISQLRPGCDLARITLPTFILEQKSMLERISNAMQHPDILIEASTEPDYIKRFILVLKFFMSGWHILPAGVKKPMNPILGEHFSCHWDLGEGVKAYYLAEQVSHHPPASAYFYIIPKYGIRIDGILEPKSKFLGNSAASIMHGDARVSFTLGPGKGEQYVLSQPNIYVRGILFGKLKLELGDYGSVKCEKNSLDASIEFKVKGYVFGTYDAVEGICRENDQQLFDISGKWNEIMMINDTATAESTVFFDTSTEPLRPIVRPIENQEANESRRLWKPVTDALACDDQTLATDEKFKIEDQQREDNRARERDGVDWTPRFFVLRDNEWVIGHDFGAVEHWETNFLEMVRAQHSL